MKVLVTGGCGFVGSHLSEELLARGEEVTVIGLTCGLENIKTFQNDVSFSKVDVRNYDHVKRVIQPDIDAIFHLASLVNVDDSRRLPMRFLETNVNGTVNLLESARKAGTDQFIYMSTCEVYGNVPEGKADETHPTDPRSPYAASKFAAERYALSYAHTYGTAPSIKVVRGFNQYGPRQSAEPSGGVIAKFSRALVEEEPLRIYGNGEQTRDYVFVKDTVDALTRVLSTDIPSGEVINIATAEDQSILHIAQSLCKLDGVDPDTKIRFLAGRPGELLRSRGDWAKAHDVLGWQPSTPFQEGLKETLAWYRQNLVS